MLINLNTIFMDFITLLIMFCTTLILLSFNPIYASLLLVCLFCLVSIFFIFFNLTSLAFVFIIIYAGAIAVLFLFIVMLLNLRKQIILEKKKDLILNKQTNIILLFLLLIIYFFFTINKLFFVTNNTIKIEIFTNGGLDALFDLLYNKYLIITILCGLILFVAMIGAIILILPYKKND